MTPEQKATFVQSQVACALIEVEAMKAENSQCTNTSLPPTYSQMDFLALIEKYQIGHDAVLSLLR